MKIAQLSVFGRESLKEISELKLISCVLQRMKSKTCRCTLHILFLEINFKVSGTSRFPQDSSLLMN